MPSCSKRPGGKVMLLEAEPQVGVDVIGNDVVIANHRPTPGMSKGTKREKLAIVQRTPSHCGPRGGGSLPRMRRVAARTAIMVKERVQLRVPKRGNQGLPPHHRHHHPLRPPRRHLRMIWTIPSWLGWRSCDRCATQDDERLAVAGRPLPPRPHPVERRFERDS